MLPNAFDDGILSILATSVAEKKVEKYEWSFNSCCVLDGMIYVCGGIVFDVLSATTPRLTMVYLEKLINYLFPNRNMIQMRSDAAAVSAGGKIYVSGGFNGTEVLTSVEVYTPATNTWIEISNMPRCLNLFQIRTPNGAQRK
ncbi:unnamed protein product [Heligmosomoides polygyrus]|uniref:Kelch-like protein 29 n=1 Tax=Heligmosomoides polygyrus TaxID=6339 RepID=A0A183FK22_HELPZ|nr:unnamed protein product [Heligmosomoides polygyrus]